MTCIVGAVHDGVVYIGGDACASNFFTAHNAGNTKVFRKGEALIGVCGSYKVIDLLTYHMPSLSDTLQNYDSYLRTEFMPSVFNTLAKWAWNKDEEYDFQFLLGFKGKLFAFQSDFSILNTPSFGYAIGSGGEVAMGSLVTTADSKMHPRARILLALKAAETVVPTVRGPFEVLTQPEVVVEAPVRKARGKKNAGEDLTTPQ